MHTLRRRWSTRAGAALLIALLLVPLTLGGHRHDAGGMAARTCGTCVIAHHSPIVAVPVLAATAPPLRHAPFAARPIVSCARGERPAATGRAPPFLGSLHAT